MKTIKTTYTVTVTKVLKRNESNPRTIDKTEFEKLKKSIKEFPSFMKVNPLILSEEGEILGGNQRYEACKALGWEDIPTTTYTRAIHQAEETEGKSYEERCNEIVIKDNTHAGDWDWDILANEWDAPTLGDYGVKIPAIKNTDMLSGLKYKSVYFEPQQIPNLELTDCVDMSKYEKKMNAISALGLPKEKKDILQILAYRFIRIDFEHIATYYAFNANDTEKKALERLRTVLIDGGEEGFIEDDLLRVLGYTNAEL